VSRPAGAVSADTGVATEKARRPARRDPGPFTSDSAAAIAQTAASLVAACWPGGRDSSARWRCRARSRWRADSSSARPPRGDLIYAG
jgi:hypothetical protein